VRWILENWQGWSVSKPVVFLKPLDFTHNEISLYREKIAFATFHLLRVGWRNFFPVVLLCQFLVLAGNRCWFYLLCAYILRVQYSCGVVLVFWFWREIDFGVTYMYLVYNTLVRLCQFFGCGGKLFPK
jgi:hypothetical protein